MERLPLEILSHICAHLDEPIPASTACEGLMRACLSAYTDKMVSLIVREPCDKRTAAIRSWFSWALIKMRSPADACAFLKREIASRRIEYVETVRLEKLIRTTSWRYLMDINCNGTLFRDEKELILIYPTRTLARFIIYDVAARRGYPYADIQPYIDELARRDQVPNEFALALWVIAPKTRFRFKTPQNTEKLVDRLYTLEDYTALGKMAHWCTALGVKLFEYASARRLRAFRRSHIKVSYAKELERHQIRKRNIHSAHVNDVWRGGRLLWVIETEMHYTPILFGDYDGCYKFGNHLGS